MTHKKSGTYSVRCANTPSRVFHFSTISLILMFTVAACGGGGGGGGFEAAQGGFGAPPIDGSGTGVSTNPPTDSGSDSSAPLPAGLSHGGRFTQYAGSATCLPCHAQVVRDVFNSVHYQWRGETPFAEGQTTGGKLGGMNDFCIYPDINFIGQLTNLDGQTVDGGCAKCHVGMGLKPEPTATPEQLANIDCLVCHSDKYVRKVANVNGVLKFAPDTAKMTVSYLEAISDITKPGSGICLSCHVYAGGGNNNKRGDIEEAHRNVASRDFDVHMASTGIGGAGLSCTDCHVTANHRFAGRGVDLRVTDLNIQIACTDCHGATPHDVADLNVHTARVDCTVCHIPYFAKGNSTDMFRDYSRAPTVVEATRLYEPYHERQGNVQPVYRFNNGTSRFYQFGDPAVPGPDGRIVMAGPLGAISDPGAKIVALKHHQAVQPIDQITNRLLPLKMGILFQQGDVYNAVMAGAAAVGWSNPTVGYAGTERLMGLYHEVAPKEQALSCQECHGGTRLDFATLGYTPNATRNGRPLCASCHGDESNAWNASQLFTNVHDRHVDRENLNCSSCHNFQRASN